MTLDTVRIVVLIIVALIYAYFDVFNKRNIPDAFAYVCLVVAALSTLAYPQATIIYSVVAAAIVAVIFYVFYRMGQVGAGDGFELVTLSLLLPVQPSPILSNLPSLMPFDSPFILSVFVATGIVTLIGVPIYYLLIAKGSGVENKARTQKEESRSNLLKAVVILAAYILLYIVLVHLFGPNPYGAAIIFIMGVFSAITIMYSRKINSKMVALRSAKDLEEGDMIATNFISRSELASLSKKYGGFGALVTRKLTGQFHESSLKLPVYENSVPLSLSIFVAVIISLLVGNMLFFVI